MLKIWKVVYNLKRGLCDRKRYICTIFIHNLHIQTQPFNSFSHICATKGTVNITLKYLAFILCQHYFVVLREHKPAYEVFKQIQWPPWQEGTDYDTYKRFSVFLLPRFFKILEKGYLEECFTKMKLIKMPVCGQMLQATWNRKELNKGMFPSCSMFPWPFILRILGSPLMSI